MARKPTAKQRDKARDAIITLLYNRYCAGRQINVLKMPAMFKTARTMLDTGAMPDEIGAMMQSACEPVS
jgi:hypothetical protein